MDIVHHAMIGGVGFSVLASNNQEIAGAALLGATVFPDLDAFFILFGKRFYLRKHQGPTHSLILSPLFAFLLSLPFMYFFGFDVSLIVASLFGLWLHAFLDLTNTFGISLFWPLNSKRYSYNAIFFIDLPAWIMTIGFYAFFYFFKTRIIFYMYISLFSFYVLCKFLLHHHIQSTLQCELAVPSSNNPFEFFILEKTGASVKTYQYNALSKRITNTELYDAPPKEYEQMASKSQVFRDLAGITKYLYITNISQDREGTTIVARDLGVRNFGGKFGTTTLRFDGQGKLIDEMANI
jgi:membrane-bound metal-dependent hydrolase YbcI (DUF457 family)